MKNIPTFKEFNNQQLVKESYDLLEGSVSYEDLIIKRSGNKLINLK